VRNKTSKNNLGKIGQESLYLFIIVLMLIKNHKNMASKIYQGKHAYSNEQIYLVDKGKIYRGKHSYSSDEIKSISVSGINIVSNTKVYKGKSTSSSDQIITIENNKIFKGKHAYSSDQIALIEGDRLSDSEFEKIIYLIAQKNNLI